MKRSSLKLITAIILLLLIVSITWFVWPRLPIITAFAAKGMCSSVFLAHKNPENIKAEDLSFFPISLAGINVNYEEQSVTATVFGLAKRKAVYREGYGAVIVLETPEEVLKKSVFAIPEPGYMQDTILWPKGNIISDKLPEGVDYKRLNELLDTCFDAPGAEPFKKTLGIAVVYDNELIAEKYHADYNYTSLFHGWSMTKSIMGAMAGIFADEGKLSIKEPAGFKEWEKDDRRNITVENIIQMTSGLDWFENYFTISDATIMLMHNDNMLSSVTDNELKYPPGSFWYYSSGDANLLSGIIRKNVMNDYEYHNSLYSKLLHRAGMLGTRVETDASGLFVASSYSYGPVRDWARFGLLFLNDGIFAGDTILSKEWVNFMKTPVDVSNDSYAGTFWLKESNPENALSDIPQDVFFADGFLGQRVYVIPSKKLVVVRMGYGLSNFNLNNFLNEVIKTLPEQGEVTGN